ncbi:Panacea domain-containing protein [Sinomonas sp. B1-1]|uniref:Panacea domain-containing protein n=1 Tax=Sinomonas sp. B1-1 TaxID=3141454 RepID=UPI003D2B34B4
MDSALDVGAYIAQRYDIRDAPTIQLLAYYSQAWALVWSGRPLFADEIEAWADGPVVRSIYAAEKAADLTVRHVDLSEDAQETVEAVCRFYVRDGRLTVPPPSSSSAEPWRAVAGMAQQAGLSRPVVSQAAMRRYYARLSLEGLARPAPPALTVEVADEGKFQEFRKGHARRWRAALDRLADL